MPARWWIAASIVVVMAWLAGCATAPPRDPTEWIIGTWEGSQTVPFGTAAVRIVFDKRDAQVHWRRDFLSGPFTGANSATASGLATISGDQVELNGTYETKQRFTGAVSMSLKRGDGDSLKGTATGRDGLPNAITLQKKRG